MSIGRKCVYWMKMCILTKNTHIEWKCVCQKVYIERSQSFILDIPKCVYWPKMCLLNENVPIGRRGARWMKMCLSKGVYWNVIILHIGYTKKCLLTENVFICRKCVYWQKIYLLKNEKSQMFDVFKYIHDIILCNHVA